jgi:Hint domain
LLIAEKMKTRMPPPLHIGPQEVTMRETSKDLKGETQRTRRNVLRAGALFGSLGISGIAWAAPPDGAPAIGYRRKIGDGDANCLLKGAQILTVRGEVKVEDLAVGDLVPTMFGGPSPIQWIGRYSFKRSDLSKPWPKRWRPVCIARSALAPDVPRRNLYVTQPHALFLDGVLISAGYLINGATITLDEASQQGALEYYHIKLERHDVIYAEGAPQESLLNVEESAVNFAEYLRVHGARVEEEVRCLPILSTYRQGTGLKSRLRRAASFVERQRRIGAIRERLAERAMMLSRQSELV